MKFAKFVATLMSLAAAGMGLLGLAAPDVLLGFGASLISPPALYWVAAVRVLFGALLIFIAAESRTPKTLRVVGGVIIIAGLLTPLFGSERGREILDWLSARGPLAFRFMALLPLIVGLLLAYTINARRGSSLQR